ncbi:MAG: DUF393 domain-containing protein [Bacteroidia bacterium]|nr:DUF393 domain-containing protein [Bacteroidia bacterium]
MSDNKQPIIFFDGVCNFCNATVDWIWKRNRKQNLFFSSLQSNFAQQFLLDQGIQNPDLSTIYFFDGNRLFNRSKAVLSIMRHFGFGYQLLSSMLNIFPAFIGDFVYDQIAQRRYNISGKRSTCRIPSQEERSRFFE